MGTPGVPWKPPKELVIDILTKNGGLMYYSAAALSVCYDTLKRYIDNDPELIALVQTLRYGFKESLLDKAENVLAKALEDKDINIGLKAAFYILNNQGRSRGYEGIKQELNEKSMGFLHKITDVIIKDECIDIVEKTSDEHKGS